MKFDLQPGSMGLKLRYVMPPCVAGIDVRPGSYDIIVADFQDSRIYERRVLRPVFIGKVRDERESIYVMLNYGVKTCVIDARPETTLAKRLQVESERHFVDAYRAQYNTQPSAVEYTYNENEKLYTLERTMTLDRVQHLFMNLQRVALPRNYQEITGRQFVSEMTSSTRTPTIWHGRDYHDWVERGADHAFHAFNMCLHAAIVSGLFEADMAGGAILSRGKVASSQQDALDPDDPGFKKKYWESITNEQTELSFEA